MARIIGVGDEAFSGGEFAPIPAGTKLRVSVFDVKETVTGENSKTPGQPQFVFTAKVQDEFEWVDPERGPQRAKGREIRYNYIPLFKGAGNAWALVSFAEAVGWKTDSKTGNVEVPDNLSDVLGVEFIAKIGAQAGQDGKVYNRVTGYAKLGGKTSGSATAEAPAKKSWGDV